METKRIIASSVETVLNTRPAVELLEARQLLSGSTAASKAVPAPATSVATATSFASRKTVAPPAATKVPVKAIATAIQSLTVNSSAQTVSASDATSFSHPGLLFTEADFDRMKAGVAAGSGQIYNGWVSLINDGYAQLGSTPRATATVIRGGTGDNYNNMVIDIQRTYELALRWKISGDSRYGDAAVKYLNAWSTTMTTLSGNADRFLASGLGGFDWCAAADIMRSYSGWAAADVTKFQNLMLNVFYPMQLTFLYGNGGKDHNGAVITNYWSNWDLANIQGMMAVGVFCDRPDIYNTAMTYLTTGRGNGALDRLFAYRHPGNLFQMQESGRDQGHTLLSISLFGHIAQMAWNQGTDLFSYNNYAFLAGAEYVAKYNAGYDVPYQSYTTQSGNPDTGTSIFTESTIGSGSRGNGGTGYALIVAHYTQLLGLSAKYSNIRAASIGTEGRNNGDDMGFGTLTYSQLNSTTTPQPPVGLTAKESGRGTVELDWFGGANTTSYNIYRATSSTGAYALIKSGVTDLLTYTDYNLPAGTYYYKVTGVNGATETAASNIASAVGTWATQTQLSFNDNTGTTATDSSGNGHNGTLVNGAAWTTGKTGSAISFDGTDDYVQLPDGVVKDVTDFTISAWVYSTSTAPWQRVFDFGENDGRWMILTPRNNAGLMEFDTSTNYSFNKQVITAPAMATNQWVHVAVTLAGKVATLYVNGVAVGSNSSMDYPPSQIGSTASNYLGKSQTSSDAYFKGKIDDFNISKGAMTAGEIYTLATGNTAPTTPTASTLTATVQIGNSAKLNWSAANGATGYEILRATTAGGPYTVISTILNSSTLTFTSSGLSAGVTYYYVVKGINNGGEGDPSNEASIVALPPLPGAPSSLVAKSNSPSSITLTWAAGSDATTYTVKRSLTSGGPYSTIASGLTALTYTDTGLTAGTDYYYVVMAVNASGYGNYSNEATDSPADLRARLTFNENTGTVASDVTGNGYDGTLTNGAAWLAAGKLSSAVSLDGVNDYVSLPSGVVSGLSAITISAWVNPAVLTTWGRIFDFGNGTNSFMYFTPKSGSGLTFGITTGGWSGQQQITSSTVIPANAWSHVAITIANGVGTLYINGVQAGQNTAMTLTPASLGNTTLNYLGRSQYTNDPYFNGKIDDFRVYARALSGSEINKLATTSTPAAPTNLSATANGSTQIDLAWTAVANATAGYTVLRSSNSGGPFTAIATHLTETTYSNTDLTAGLAAGTTYSYVVVAENAGGESSYSNVATATVLPTNIPDAVTNLDTALASSGQVSLTWTAAANAASYTISRASSDVGPYTTIASGVTATTYKDTGLTNGSTYYYVVAAVNAVGSSDDSPGIAAVPTDQRVRLKLDETSGTTAFDASGNGLNATLVNGPTWSTGGKLGRALNFDGSNDYATLPAGITSDLTAVTFSTWVNLDNVTTYFPRIFDFGTGTTNFMYLSAKNDAGGVGFAISTGGWSGRQTINSTTALAAGTWAHIAVTIADGVGTLYVNGVQVAQNTSLTLTPASLGNTTQNYVGKSQFSNDPYLDGRVDDLRIYSRALSAAEIATLATQTAPSAPTSLATTSGDSQVTLNWAASANATSYMVKRATVSGGPYATIAANVTGTTYIDGSAANGTTYYYVVSASNLIDEGPNSAQVTATPVAVPAPMLSSFVINDGSQQRSRVTSFTLTFDQPVALDSSDLTLMQNNAPVPNVELVLSSTTGLSTQYTVTFNGSGVTAGSLNDGQFTLVLNGALISNGSNVHMASSPTASFYRLFGDADGDGTVNFNDFLLLQAAFGSKAQDASFVYGLDGDGDNTINFNDFLLLQANFDKTL